MPDRNKTTNAELLKTTSKGNNQQPDASLSQMIEGMPAWVQLCGLDGRVEMVNGAASRISGYDRSEMLTAAWPYQWLPDPGDALGADPFAQLKADGQLPEFEVTCVTKGGQLKPLAVNLTLLRDANGEPQSVLIVAWDLSRRQSLEGQKAQAQKIQAVSQLASGVAHDINNNLAVIMGYSEFLLGKSDGLAEGERQALSAIQQQSEECANTVRRIQLFSRSVPRNQFTVVAVNDIVHEVIRLTEDLWNHQARRGGVDIRLDTDLGRLPPVNAYLSGLKDALISLVNNAVDALPAGGRILLQTRHEGKEVVIRITDSGAGVDPAVAGRIFDPFFTTKGPARSGLGLSIAYNLINQQSGAIALESRQAPGATFTVRLPAPWDVENGSGEPDPRRAPALSALSVLVVDDEPLVADMMRTFLESSGHRVVTCPDGARALEVFERDKFDLAVVDLGMEGMDGWEVSRRIHAVRPGFPIILASGWEISVVDGQEQGVDLSGVLHKPFTITELFQAVSQGLRRQNAA